MQSGDSPIILRVENVALERDNSRLTTENWKLKEEVYRLNREVEKVTGMSPKHLESLQENIQHELDRLEDVVRQTEESNKKKLAELDLQIRKAIEKHLSAELATKTEQQRLKGLKKMREALSDDIAKLFKKATEDKKILIIQPNFHGIGVNLLNLAKGVKSLFGREKNSQED